MINAVEMLRGQLADLPTDHPDRAGIEAMVTLGEGWHPGNAFTETPVVITAEHTLELATSAYKADRANPVLLAEFNQAFWSTRRQAMGLSERDLVVSDGPYSEAEIRKFMGLGRGFRKPANPDFALFVPEVTSTTPDGLILLGKGWPILWNSAFKEGTRVQNVEKDGSVISLHGWMRTEKSIDAPHLRTNQEQGEKIVSDAKRIGDTLNIYGAAGLQSKLLEGKYLDEVKTWIRTLSSRGGGQVVRAGFVPGGGCFVVWNLGSLHVDGGLGVRSVEVPELKA